MNFLATIEHEINVTIYPVITICYKIFVILCDLCTMVYKIILRVNVSKEKKLWQPIHEEKTKDLKIDKQMKLGDVHLLRVEYCVKTIFFSFITFVI